MSGLAGTCCTAAEMVARAEASGADSPDGRARAAGVALVSGEELWFSDADTASGVADAEVTTAEGAPADGVPAAVSTRSVVIVASGWGPGASTAPLETP